MVLASAETKFNDSDNVTKVTVLSSSILPYSFILRVGRGHCLGQSALASPGPPSVVQESEGSQSLSFSPMQGEKKKQRERGFILFPIGCSNLFSCLIGTPRLSCSFTGETGWNTVIQVRKAKATSAAAGGDNSPPT